jgi:hypothetical protein
VSEAPSLLITVGDELSLLITVVEVHSLLFAVGEVSGRGCASKEKLYYVQCENHEMDGLVEKFCYCSFNLCNTATTQVHTVIHHYY